MRWFRSALVGTVIAVGFSLAPLGTPAANADNEVVGNAKPGFTREQYELNALTVPPGTVLVLSNLFQVSPSGLQFIGQVDIDLSGGIEFGGGGWKRKASTLQEALTLAVVATGKGGNGIVNITIKGVNQFSRVYVEDHALSNVTIKATTTTVPAVTAASTTTPPVVPASTNPPIAPPPSVTLPTTTVTINRPPFGYGQDVVVRPNSSARILLNGEDPELQILSFSIVAPPLHGRVKGQRPRMVYVPDKRFVGADAFSYTVSDGTSTSAPIVVFINVTNERPVGASLRR
jgi:hypothetical protein